MIRNKTNKNQRFFDSHTGDGFEVAAGAVVAPSPMCALELCDSFPAIWENVLIDINPPPTPEEG